jgi:hypothetical protein
VFWRALHGLVQVLHPKPVHFATDNGCMTKIPARLFPIAVLATGFIAAFGGYFGSR